MQMLEFLRDTFTTQTSPILVDFDPLQNVSIPNPWSEHVIMIMSM